MSDETSKKGGMTLDKLAEIIDKTVAKREDLKSLATKEDLKLVDDKIDALEHAVKENFRLVREEIKMLNFAVEIDDLRERMARLEKKVGITK